MNLHAKAWLKNAEEHRDVALQLAQSYRATAAFMHHLCARDALRAVVAVAGRSELRPDLRILWRTGQAGGVLPELSEAMDARLRRLGHAVGAIHINAGSEVASNDAIGARALKALVEDSGVVLGLAMARVLAREPEPEPEIDDITNIFAPQAA